MTSQDARDESGMSKTTTGILNLGISMNLISKSKYVCHIIT